MNSTTRNNSTPDPKTLNMERLKEQLILHEGYRTKTYRDSVGVPTIGVGFNLQRKDAQYLLTSIGADYDAVLRGDHELTDDQIQFLLDYTLSDSIQSAKAIINNYDDLFDVRKRVVIDMIFNLGMRGFFKFHRTRQAIEDSEFKLAAQYMRESLWCGQVKSRCSRLSNMMESGNDFNIQED